MPYTPRRLRLPSLLLATGLVAVMFGAALWTGPLPTPLERKSVALFAVGAVESTASPQTPPIPAMSAARPPAPSKRTVPAGPMPQSSAPQTALAHPPSEGAHQAGGCELGVKLQAVLQSDDAITASLDAIPSAEQSVASAVMVWNTDWLPVAAARLSRSHASIRDVVSASIAAATFECRAQPQIGPQLLVVRSRSRSMVLAFGSGRWRWQDLIEPPAVVPPEEPAAGA